MPLSPEISLQGRPIQITAPDPMQTLVTVAQLRNMQSQEQLRNLQMAGLGNQLGEYQRVQGVLRDYRQQQADAPQPGMVAGPQLASLPPGGGAMPQTPPFVSGGASGPRPLYDQLSPETQALYPNGPPPDAGQLPSPERPPPQAPAPPGPAPQAAASSPQGYEAFPSMESLGKQVQMLRNLAASGPTYGVPMAKEMSDLLGRDLSLRKELLDLHLQGMAKGNEVLAGVKDETSWQEAHRLLTSLGAPDAAQMAQLRFDDPKGQEWLTYRRASAQTQQQRVENELKRADQMINAFNAATTRQTEERTGRTVTTQPTATGIQLQRTFPPPGSTGTTPMLTPGGQPALPPEYGRQKEFYDAQGNLHVGPEYVPPGQQARVQRPLMPPGSPVPGYAAPPAGTSAGPAPGAPSPLMSQEAVQKNLDVGRDVQKTQLNAAIPQAEAARNSLNTLGQMKQLMHEGYYDDLFAKDLAGADAQKALIAAGRDPQKLANTFQIQNLANQLVIDAQGGRGLRVGPTEIGKLNAASGRLDTIPPKAAALQTVEQLRQLTTKDLAHFNELTQSPNTPQLRPYSVPQTLPKADFDRRYTALKALNPALTKDELALRYERAGVHVEGAY